MENNEKGFTLTELLIALAVVAVLGMLLIRVISLGLNAITIQTQRDAEHAAVDRLADRWRAEEDSAWAIFTPGTDVDGLPNEDGHELDFFTRDGANQSYFWAYNYDAASKTLTRYLYSQPGGTAVFDEAYTGITKFYAHTYPVTALQDKSSQIYCPLYDNAQLVPGAVRFYGPSHPDIAGGNQITYVRLEAPTNVEDMQLTTATAPSGFTVVLQYTPNPSPSASPTVGPSPQSSAHNALSAWPAAVELPLKGQALQTASLPPPHDTAFYLNRLLGGGMAYADATPCAVDQGRAFTDATFSELLTNATTPAGVLPSGVSGYTDASGCIFMKSSIFTRGTPNVALYEPGYAGILQEGRGSCEDAIVFPAQYPAGGQGPQLQLVTEGAAPIDQCSVKWSDQSTTPQTTSTAFRVLGEETVTFSDLVHCGRLKVGADFNYTCTHVQHVTADSECYANATWTDRDLASPDSSVGQIDTVMSPPMYGTDAWTAEFKKFIGTGRRYESGPTYVTSGCPGG